MSDDTPEQRAPRPDELALLRKLLDNASTQREALCSQLEDIKVSQIDENGSLRLWSTTGYPVSNANQLPVEGFFEAGTVGVSILLHVIQGRLHELEVVPDDPQYALKIPDMSQVQVFARGNDTGIAPSKLAKGECDVN